MLIIITGPSGSGKSSAVNHITDTYGIAAYSGKDYLRLAKNEHVAWNLFMKHLKSASATPKLDDQSMIYNLVEIWAISHLLKTFSHKRVIKFTATIDMLKKRFSQRLGNRMNPGINKMIEVQTNRLATFPCDLEIDTTTIELSENLTRLENFLNEIKG